MTVFAPAERRFLVGITAVLGLRQLALLLVLPFIALHAAELAGNTPVLVGLALGVNGLLQGLLQLPFGRWSDRAGRKPLILLGLALLIVGLVVAARATDITWLIVGRALQGSGAITGTAYAWIGDNTAEDKRARAMGIAGLAVGGAAIVSFLGGPLLYTLMSVPEMFVMCAGLAALVGGYVLFGMHDDVARTNAAPAPLSALARHANLRRFVVAGFLLNYVLMAICFAVPLQLGGMLGARSLWKVFVPATLVGLLALRFVARAADAGHFVRVAALCFAALIPATSCLFLNDPLATAIGTTIFMGSYLGLTALLPAAVTRIVTADTRGTASGAYNSALFFGSFTGGTVTGALWSADPRIAIAGMLIASLLALFVIRGTTET